VGKANLPYNAATAKQCQVGSVTFIATEWFFQLKKILKFFSTSAGGLQRLGEVQPLKISLAARSFNLNGPSKIWTISDPFHLYFKSLSRLRIAR